MNNATGKVVSADHEVTNILITTAIGTCWARSSQVTTAARPYLLKMLSFHPGLWVIFSEEVTRLNFCMHFMYASS